MTGPSYARPARMLATGDAELDELLLGWLCRADSRYVGEEEAFDAEGKPILICVLLDGSSSPVVEHRASSRIDWKDAVRNALQVALTAEPSLLEGAVGLASLEALRTLKHLRGGRP